MAAGLGSGRRARARVPRVEATRVDDEQGFTLIEILITVWIMGAVMVALMGALFTMTKASDLARKTTLAETELRHYAEFVRNATYSECATGTGNYPYTPATPFSVAEPIAPSITSVTYWDGAAYNNSVPNFQTTLPTSCPTNDKGAQKITLRIVVGVSPNQVILSTTIVKRRS